MTAARKCAILALLVAVSLSGPTFAENNFTISFDNIYGHKSGMALTFDVVKPDDPNGAALLYMVSGGWVSRYFDLEKALADSRNQNGRLTNIVDKGFTLFVVRHGSSPHFKVPEAVADVRRAVRYIRYHAKDYGIDPDRLGVFGGSAGGHLSLMLGTASDEGAKDSSDPVDRTSDRVAAVVSYFPPVDLRGLAGPNDRFPALEFDESLAASISPILFVSADDPPTLLIHGDKDTLVPLSNSERILAAFKKEKVATQLIVMEGAGHGFRGKHGSDAAAALVDWFERHLVLQYTD